VRRGLLVKLLRDIARHRGQFIAAGAVVMAGLSVYVGLYSTFNNLNLTRDSYYQQYRFSDFFLELERAPETAVRQIESIPGVWRAHGRIVEDVPLDVEGNDESIVGRLISMPDEPGHALNDIYLVSGSYFPGADEREVIVNQRFCEANGLRVGDTFEATVNERRERLRIVGTAYSPEYVYALRNPQQFGPNDKGFAVIFCRKDFVESAFNMGGAVNSIVGQLRPGADLDAVLEEAEERLDSYGVYHTYGSADQLSNRYLTNEIDGLRASAIILPLVFLTVAALIIHVIMTRITEQQRTQIGLLCALGYSKFEIVLHYVGYALFVATFGTVVGALVGQWLAKEMTGLYIMFFRFPVLESRFYPSVFGSAFALSAAACVLGTVVSVLHVARLEPAQAMRPSAPPTGRRIFLERMDFIWSRLSLDWRTTIRNTIRARARTVLTLLGVVIATVILIMGMSSSDFFEYIIDFQHRKVDVSDLHVDFVTERPPEAVREVARLDGVRCAEGVLQYGFEFENAWRKKTVLVQGLERDGALLRVYDTRGERIRVPEEGFLVPDRLAKGLGATTGSRVTVDPYVKGKDEREATLRAVADQYIGLTAYADRAYLCELLGEGDMVNGALLRVEEDKLDKVIEELDDMPGVSASVSNRRILQGIRESMAKMIAIAVTAQTLFAGLIALAVIYNSSTISISERERELASFRALGFDVDQVTRIATNDIIPLGLLGIAIGLPLGRLLMGGIARLYETDLFKVPAVISPKTYFSAALAVFVFLVISRIVCKRKVVRIDIVRALKTRE